MADDEPADLDVEWWRYRLRQSVVLAAVFVIFGVLGIVLALAAESPDVLVGGMFAFVMAMVFTAHAIWKFHRGPQPGETPVREIDLTDEQVEAIAEAIASGVKGAIDD